MLRRVYLLLDLLLISYFGWSASVRVNKKYRLKDILLILNKVL